MGQVLPPCYSFTVISQGPPPLSLSRQVAQLCQREVKKLSQKSQRTSKEVSVQPRARRLMREALMYWKRYEKTEKEQRRKAEREAVEQRKIDDEMREVIKYNMYVCIIVYYLCELTSMRSVEFSFYVHVHILDSSFVM